MFEWMIKRERMIKILIVFFYVVGGIGMVFSFLSPIIIKLTPIVLIFSFILLMMFHNGKLNQLYLILFILIYFISFVIEVTGVNTGMIFGEYTYGDTLGFKIFNTPVIIGLNWLLLTYLTSSIVENYDIGNLSKIFIASILMVLYDFLLEKVAPILDMWRFNDSTIPINNYVSWLLIAIIFNTLIKIFRVEISNRLSATIFISQLIFFICIIVLLGL